MTHIEKLKNILDSYKNNKEIDVYQINETDVNRYELYYVLNKLETSRTVCYKSAAITIYKDFKENEVLYKGSASFNLDENLSDDEINSCIKESIKRTSFVKNKYYELPKPVDKLDYFDSSNIKDESLEEIAFKISKAIFKANVYKDGWINSTEIFVSRSNCHFVNSLGCDYCYPKYHMMIEVIPTWSGKTEEVELYYSQYANSVDYNYITQEVDEILLQAKNRGEATKLPDDIKEATVILQKEEVKEFLSFYASNMSYPIQYRQMTRYKVGDVLQDLSTSSEYSKFDMKMVPFILGSSTSSPIDSLGTVLKEVKVIEDGKIINTYGDCKFGYYMGIKEPTGSLRNLVVKNGNKSIDEMKQKPYLLCLNFSAFQLDDDSGYYGGEVRMAMYFDGKTIKPVTRFSVIGDVYNDCKNVVLSKEEITLNGYHGPKYLQVKMKIAK